MDEKIINALIEAEKALMNADTLPNDVQYWDHENQSIIRLKKDENGEWVVVNDEKEIKR